MGDMAFYRNGFFFHSEWPRASIIIISLIDGNCQIKMLCAENLINKTYTVNSTSTVGFHFAVLHCFSRRRHDTSLGREIAGLVWLASVNVFKVQKAP